MAKQGKDTKIALVGYILADGGQERVFSAVSELLHEAGCQVHVIVLEDKVKYPFYGTLINLGIYSKFQKYFQLRKVLKQQHFDYIIDFRYRLNPLIELFFLNYIYSGFKTIYTIHSSKLDIYFTNNKFVAKQIFEKIYKIVSVSTAMNAKIVAEYHFEKGVVIPNSISEKTVKLDTADAPLAYKYCIAIGRLVAMKQFDKLIETYCESNLPKQEIHLVILGDGEEKERLQQQIERCEMTQFIHLLGFIENTFGYTKNAEFLVLSSEYEGFGMVILEALHLGTPVISFDCETGPAEMIVNEKNGLLVENQNFSKLQEALNRMAEDATLYQTGKKNAKISVVQFSMENVQKKWLDLMDIKTN